MGVIKGVLKEELQNSLGMKAGYEKALRELPKGSLSILKRNGKGYYYLKYREKGRVINKYIGIPQAGMVEKYRTAVKMRKKYRHLLSVVKKQIRFLRGTLRGKESI
ncbi:MAG: hypothetical protein LLG37_04025 [Spirochaetia bacterium]|nr:hypothetical protein [Spirochaetia bacterium]